MKHVQIITLYTRALSEYLHFVDLDCTALAFDGKSLFGCRRSLLAHTTFANFVPKQMLFIRRDTPRRIGKYCQRGFSAFVDTPLTLPEEQEKWTDALNVRGCLPPRFLDVEFADDDDEEALVLSLMDGGHSYTETRLPRGFYVEPHHVLAFLRKYQERAAERDERLITSTFDGKPHVCEKLKVKTEKWWHVWGMVL